MAKRTHLTEKSKAESIETLGRSVEVFFWNEW